MKTTIKKGTEVWLFEGWNRRATIRVTRCIVQSIGKIQATVTFSDGGEYRKHFVYARDYGNMVAVADLPDPTAEALRRAVEYKAANLAYIVNVVHGYSSSGSAGYFSEMRREAESILAESPTVITR